MKAKGIMDQEQNIVESPGRGRGFTAGIWLLLFTGLAIGFGHTFAEMWYRWFPAWKHSGISLYEGVTRGESYYTHAPLVPVVSLIIILLLIRLTSIPVRPRFGPGLIVLGFGLLIHLAACLARVNFMSGFAFISVLIGIVLLIWGMEAVKRFWFPLMFLIFMVPLPEVSIAQLNFRLKMVAADWGVQLSSGIGIVVERLGSQVFLEGGKSMVVANICNGLRTLISVIAFGVLYAFICQLRGVWRIVLFSMSVPVAVVSNSFRIVTLILVADLWDVETATGWYHDFSGLMILVMAFGLLFGVEKVILWIRRKVGRPAEMVPMFHDVRRTSTEEHQLRYLFEAFRTWNGAIAVMVIGAAAAGSVYLNRSTPAIYNEHMLKDALPNQICHKGELWDGYPLDVDPETALVLETEEIVQRVYVDPRGSVSVNICVIFSEDNRKGTHPPDLCLEGGGMNIIAKNDVRIPEIPGHKVLPCRELIVQSGQGYTYFLYTYKCGSRYTASFWLQQFMIFANGLFDRNASGALIRISTPMTAGPNDDQAQERAAEFLRMGIPYLEDALP